jgi:sensor histidine kinase regulating citrate/malate metabolism
MNFYMARRANCRKNAPEEARMVISPRGRMSLQKLTRSAIVINAVQILAALGIAVYALLAAGFHLSGPIERAVVGGVALVVIWGAAVDIREAYSARWISAQRQMLEDAYQELETLNATLRAQRHDFMNHVQVVYSLTELGDSAAALEYMDRVYKDLQRVGRALKTSVPAINALIAAKMADCEAKGIQLKTDITSSWDGLPVPGWEMCRVLGNLIDNAVEALGPSGPRRLTVSLTENVREYAFFVENDGRKIPEEMREAIFEMGFSTKGEGRGMGLHTVRRIVREAGGEIRLDPDSALTRFCGTIPKGNACDIARLPAESAG